MASADRTPCINPRCNRTYKSEDGGEVICGKCFRVLPSETRNFHRRIWREIRKWRRRITRSSDPLEIEKMHRIEVRLVLNLNRHWDADIKTYFLAPQRPEGLESFLEEMGLKE